jgi:hypothetical protein
MVRSLVVRDVNCRTAFDGAGVGSAIGGSSLLFVDVPGIMPVRHVFGLPGAGCTGTGEGVQTSRLHPVIPGSAGPGGVETKVSTIRIVEHRKVTGPVTRTGAVPGNGCSSLPLAPIGAPLPSLSGKQKWKCLGRGKAIAMRDNCTAQRVVRAVKFCPIDQQRQVVAEM